MIITKNLTKVYNTGTIQTTVLKGIDLEVRAGEFVSIIGPSGSGKSTLLYQLGLLDHPTTGIVSINGVETTTMTSEERTTLRLQSLGFVFQNYAILPELTALENVLLPALMQGKTVANASAEATAMLDRMGLKDHMYKLPSQLSGGQQQRVSIARAAAKKPTILFADEPTANLDSSFSEEVMSVLQMLHSEGQTIVLVTHEDKFAARADRIIAIQDGLVV